MEKTLYRVTDAAPSHVCGQRVQAGDPMRLYPQVAEYERDLGHLAEVSAEAEGSSAAPALDEPADAQG